ncbi:hypothetical protein [Kribbella turkmenica]|uniref:hypothetical protein n=1 Tax=Kribbella turkmenica TaxID=2530375 RepID=UPI001F18FA15|nr:hypothetical protein [Kribbella turkmenica]
MHIGAPSTIRSWNTYKVDPFDGWRISAARRWSHAAWHMLVATVADGHVKYYIDDGNGHTVYPRRAMTLNYNQWFIDLDVHSGGRSSYVQAADWVYYAKNEVLTPTEAVDRVNAYRSAGATHANTINC